MERVDIVDGWGVEFSPPVLRILEGEAVRFECDRWDPKMHDAREDALAWAGIVADPYSGLTLDADDDPQFAAGVTYVRTHAPAMFADECALMSGEYGDES